MSYPRQLSTLNRLQAIAYAEMDKKAAKHLKKLTALWTRSRIELRHVIVEAYQRSMNEKGKWTLSSFRGSGSENHLRMKITSIMQQFDTLSKTHVKHSLNDIYRESILRHAWILDQVTPGHHTIKMPARTVLHEASALRVYSGTDWPDRWSAWTDAYRSALMNNVTMNALNSSDLSEAVNEVDVTRANTPAYRLFDALSRVYEYEAVVAMAGGENTVAALNASMVEVEIWKTRGDLDVCDECEANEGLPLEEADGMIPLHPNCHCYPLLVPKNFADILRAGSYEDVQLANEALSHGIVPNALIIRGPDGEIAAKTVIDFTRWTSDQGLAIQAL